MITLSWLLIIGLIGGALALIDGIIRVRGRGTAIIAVIEIIVAALFILSFFLNVPFGSLVLAIVLLDRAVVAVGIARIDATLGYHDHRGRHGAHRDLDRACSGMARHPRYQLTLVTSR